MSLTPPSAADRAARLAHEVRTPLHALLGTAELLRGTALDATQRAYLDTIADTAQALAALADEALREALREAPGGTRAAHDGASRAARDAAATHGDGDVGPGCAVRAVVGAVTQLFAPRAAARGLALHAYVDDAVPARVAVHAGRLRQVLVNLVANAVAYTPAGGVRVRVTHGPGAFGAVPALRVEVEDTGPGIAPERRARLFAPGVRGDAAAHADAPHGAPHGAGLGLAICRELVEASGGRIGVRAAAGHGSVFVVELPAPAGDADADVAPRAGRAVHVLVVDDDASARLVARRGLERLGVVVTVVDDAGAALAALEHAHAAGSPFELVLLDQRLGDDDRTDGVAVATGWRDRERALGARRVPIVAVTGDASDIAAARCRAAGMDAHLVKPVPVATLGRLVDAVRDAHDALHATGDAGEATAPPHDGEASLLAVATLERLLRLGEDATFAPALVDAWAADSERRAMLIAVAGAAGDRAVLARVAHALEGSSANVGAAAVAACAAAIRRAAEPPVARVTAAGPAVVTPDAIVAPDLEQAVAALPALVAATRAALRAAVARAVRGRTPWRGLPAVARR